MSKYVFILGLTMITFFESNGQNQIASDSMLYPRLFLDATYIKTKTQHSFDRILKLNYSIKKLPIFCKIEHKMTLRSKIPVKFRLGSVDYVDKLEGKK